jgi:hypothetical protein
MRSLRAPPSGPTLTPVALDFINKAFECLDLIGWPNASAVLPSIVGQMVAARGADESTAWRQPIGTAWRGGGDLRVWNISAIYNAGTYRQTR